MTKSYPWLRSLLICGFTIFISTPAIAQITPDNTLGAESSRLTPNVPIGGGNGDRIDGGATRGSNLFHSFSDFNVDNGQRVYFVNPNGIQNILTRVTGGNASNILGTLGVDGGANLFLLNPNGIIFGQNASLDLRGSFVGTTANAIGFGEQGFFSATDPSSPPLLTVNPSALLFTQLQAPAGITNQSIAPAGIDPNGDDTTGLRVADSKSLLLVGGNVNSDGGGLNAYGGRIELAGLSTPGSVGLQVAGNTLSLNVPNDVPRADVFLTNEAAMSVLGAGGGDIAINARNLEISNSYLIAGIGKNLGNATTQAGDITLNATGEIKVVGSNLVLNIVSSQAVGKGGNINVTADSLSLTDQSQLNASTVGKGDAGSVLVQAKNSVSVTGDSEIRSNVERGAVGNGGNINITAPTLSLTDGGQLSTVVVDASNNQPAGQGVAGNVNVNVSDTVTISGSGVEDSSTGIFSYLGTGAKGKGGDISITAGSLSLSDGALISTSTYGSGDAGSVLVQAKDSVSAAGSSVIFSNVEPGAVGNGGNINITAPTLTLTDGSQLSTAVRYDYDNQLAGQGIAGNVNVNVSGDVTISGVKNKFSGIFSYLGIGAKGKGGNINITAGSFSLSNGAWLDATTFGIGDAGSVVIDARRVFLDGNDTNIYSIVESTARGKGGDIRITTDSLSLTNDAVLTATTFGTGDAGSVLVQAKDSVSVTSNSDIRSNVERGAVGNGGNINITTPTLYLTDGGQVGTSVFQAYNNQPAGEGIAGDVNVNVSGGVTISGVKDLPTGIFSDLRTGAKGKGGNINIAAGSLSMTNGGVINTATSGKGDAGNVEINTTGDITFNNGAFVTSATLGDGNAGNVTVTAGGKASFDGVGNGLRSGIFTIVGGEPGFVGRGDGGNINLNSPTLSITNDAAISSSSFGEGLAGDIDINSGSVRLDNQGTIIAQTYSGNGGNINLTAADFLLLRRNSQISTSGGLSQQSGDGGNITINSPFIIALPNENSDITANAFSGRGGNVSITTQSLFGIQQRPLLTPQSDITASSELGVQGQIDITEPNVQPTQGLVELPVSVLDASDQIAQTCPSGANATRSLGEFVVTGRGGSLPPNPIEPLTGSTSLSPLASIDGESQTNISSHSSKPVSNATQQTIVEAQGWVKTPDGKIALVASAPSATPSASTTQATCPVSR